MKGWLIEPGHWKFPSGYHAMRVAPKEWQVTKEVLKGHRSWVTTVETLTEAREAIEKEVQP